MGTSEKNVSFGNILFEVEGGVGGNRGCQQKCERLKIVVTFWLKNNMGKVIKGFCVI